MACQDCHTGRGRGHERNRGQGPRDCGDGTMLTGAELHLAILAVLAGQPRTGLLTMQALAARGYGGDPVTPRRSIPAGCCWPRPVSSRPSGTRPGAGCM